MDVVEKLYDTLGFLSALYKVAKERGDIEKELVLRSSVGDEKFTVTVAKVED